MRAELNRVRPWCEERLSGGKRDLFCEQSPVSAASGQGGAATVLLYSPKSRSDHAGESRDAPVMHEREHWTASDIVGLVAEERRLSRRECEVLAATARGESTKQIGYALGISAPTVAYYWRQIFRKLGCRSQIEVMSLLFRRALSVAGDAPCRCRTEVDKVAR